MPTPDCWSRAVFENFINDHRLKSTISNGVFKQPGRKWPLHIDQLAVRKSTRFDEVILIRFVISNEGLGRS
jgi:hypothetical protein